MRAAASRSAPEATPAARLDRLRTRREFLAARNGRKAVTGGLMLQARDRKDDDGAIRVGFTCSKKVGNAVERNRAKRRLRAAAASVLPGLAQPGWDYVLIGFRERTARRVFADLEDDLRDAVAKVHGT